MTRSGQSRPIPESRGGAKSAMRHADNANASMQALRLDSGDAARAGLKVVLFTNFENAPTVSKRNFHTESAKSLRKPRTFIHGR